MRETPRGGKEGGRPSQDGINSPRVGMCESMLAEQKENQNQIELKQKRKIAASQQLKTWDDPESYLDNYEMLSRARGSTSSPSPIEGGTPG